MQRTQHAGVIIVSLSGNHNVKSQFKTASRLFQNKIKTMSRPWLTRPCMSRPCFSRPCSGQVWSSLINFEQVWATLVKFIKFELLWTHSIHLDSIWSSLIKFEIIFSKRSSRSKSHVGTVIQNYIPMIVLECKTLNYDSKRGRGFHHFQAYNNCGNLEQWKKY